ncbi:methyltransferase [Actinomycetaceae bacterium MB13-C1-2]|nr:methyltransferase [Actinomycetaceae bacterium MB13-C1-2]
MVDKQDKIERVEFPYQLLRRWPDAEAENLCASDATDRLLIDLAAPTIRSAAPGSVVIIGDRYGALTLATLSLGATGVRVHQDSFAGQLALAANEEALRGSGTHARIGSDRSTLDEMPPPAEGGPVGEAVGNGVQIKRWLGNEAATEGAQAEGRPMGRPVDGEPRVSEGSAGSPAVEAVLADREFTGYPLDSSLLTDARVVLIQLPKDLDQFEHWIRLVAAYAAKDVRVYAGGRTKHMTKAMNQVLERFFSNVSASRARQKSRVLFASNLRLPRPDATDAFAETYDRDLDLWVCSVPGSFASGKVDHGSRFLIDFIRTLPEPRPESQLVAADLGCGTGVLATVLVRSRPLGLSTGCHVIATDRSAAAVKSAQATLRKNVPDGDWEVRQDNALSQQADHSLDLIVCNPPFHSDAAVSTELSELLFADAARVLKPGGIMLTVFNSHLPHRRSLERMVGPTKQLGRNSKFTVTQSIKR